MKTSLYTLQFMVIAIAVTMFFSCESNFENVKKIGVSENAPIGVAKEIDLKYTDSGKVKANLISPKMLDFSNRDFAFTEFPEGVHLDLFDDNNNKSTVVSDYAVVYDATGLIDLQGHVVLATHEKDTLHAKQLFYDQNREWLFTNEDVTFRKGSDLINGKGFDSDTKFSQAEVLEIDGVITLEE